MRRTEIPPYLKFDHVIDVTNKDFNNMEGKSHSHWLHSGERSFKVGQWICFQTIAQQPGLFVPRKLIRQVSVICGHVPLYGDDTCVELILKARHGDEYEFRACTTERFINEGSAIKVI